MISRMSCGAILMTTVVATGFAQDKQCEEKTQQTDCSTCTAVDPGIPQGATFSVVANPCPGDPQVECEDCCWEVSLDFTPGTSAPIDYTETYVQEGNGTKNTTTSPDLSIDHQVDRDCTELSSTTVCVTARVTWDLGSGTLSRTECFKLTCEVCLGGLPE